MLPVWPESARQGSSNPHSPNGLWNLSSFLPTLFSLQMSSVALRFNRIFRTFGAASNKKAAN
jgi:hypothetical protein